VTLNDTEPSVLLRSATIDCHFTSSRKLEGAALSGICSGSVDSVAWKCFERRQHHPHREGAVGRSAVAGVVPAWARLDRVTKDPVGTSDASFAWQALRQFCRWC
jgi:hypothetical protein